MNPQEKQEFENLKLEVEQYKRLIDFFVYPDRYQFDQDVRFVGQRLGFFNAPLVKQPTPFGITTGMTIAGGSTVTEANAFTGGYPGTNAYTIGDSIKALKDTGILKK